MTSYLVTLALLWLAFGALAFLVFGWELWRTRHQRRETLFRAQQQLDLYRHQSTQKEDRP